MFGAVRSSFGYRCIHASAAAAADEPSRSGGGEAEPTEEVGQVGGVPGEEGESNSGPGLGQQGDEWETKLAILEKMLRELAATGQGHGVGAADDDQALAALQLLLAHEYASHNILAQEAEGLAIEAWQVRLQALGHHHATSLFFVAQDDRLSSIAA